MDIGLVLPVEGPRAGRQSIIAMARTADQLGFHSLWTTDRILMPVGGPAGYPYSAERGTSAFEPGRTWLECIAVMGLVSGVTEDVGIGTNVLVLPFRSPIVLAHEVATLDFLSGGRVVLGVGTGWMAEEFTALGVPKAKRGAITDEYIAVLRTLWNGGDSFHGTYVSFEGVSLPVTAVQPGGPPIFIGGNSTAALNRVAGHGDGWLGIDLDPGQTAVVRGRIKAESAQQGRTDVTVSMRCRIRVPEGLGGPVADGRDAAGEAADIVRRYASAGVDLLIADLVTAGDVADAVHWLATDVCPAAGCSRQRGRITAGEG